MVKQSRRYSSMEHDSSINGNSQTSLAKQIKRKKILEGKSHEEIEAFKAKESKKKEAQEWHERYQEASPIRQEIMNIDLKISEKKLKISEWNEKKLTAENQYLHNEGDKYVAKINVAKNEIKMLQVKRSKLEQQRAEEKLKRQVSKDSIQSNTNQQSKISNASKQATKNNTEKEQQNSQRSVENLANQAQQKSQTQNLPKESGKVLHREISNLRREEGALEKKLTEISKEISKAEPLVTAIITDHAKLKQLSEKIKATSKWSGVRNLWRRIIDKDSKDEKIDKYEKTEKQLKENIEDKKSQLTEMTPKLKELKVEKSTVSASLAKIRANIAANQEQQRGISNKLQKKEPQRSH